MERSMGYVQASLPCSGSRRARCGLGAAISALVLVVAPAAGQVQPPGHSIGAGVTFERYQFDDGSAVGISSLTLLTVPFHGALSLGRHATLDMRGAFASGTMEPADGKSVSVSGLTDTELRLGLRTGGATVVQVQGIAVLPTGNVSHTAEEALVAGAVAADLLPFRISNWGSGGGLGAHTSVARSFGDTGAGFSVSYVVGREFEPAVGAEFGYQPGNQLRLRAGLDHNLGPASKVTLAVSMERFSEDLLDGRNLYRAGNRIQVVSSYAFRATARSSALVYGGVFHRSQGTALLEAIPSAPSQQQLLGGGGIRMPAGPVVLVPGVDARLLRSADGAGQGWLTGLGLAVELRAGGQVLVPAARARFGNVVVRDGVESGITGLELSFTSRMTR